MECEFDREYYVTLFEYHCTSPCSQIELETEEGGRERARSWNAHTPTPPPPPPPSLPFLHLLLAGWGRHARMYGPRTGTEKSSGLGIIEALANLAGTNFTKPHKSQSCLLGTPLYIACAQDCTSDLHRQCKVGWNMEHDEWNETKCEHFASRLKVLS